MPVNPYLLNQAAQGTEAPLNAFLPAFQQSQDRILKRDLLEEERQQRHQQNLFKWNEYVQKERERQSESENLSAFREEFGALSTDDPDYGMKAHRIATKYGQSLEGASLIPKGNETQDPEEIRLARIANDPSRPPHERQAAAAALKKATHMDDGGDSYVWAAFIRPGSETVEFGRRTDRELRDMEARGGLVMPPGTLPSETADFLGGGKSKLELADDFVIANSMFRTGNEVLEIAATAPESVGWAGEAVNLGYSLVDNANRLVGLASPETPKNEFIEKNQGLFQGVAEDNAALQSLVYDFVYSYLAFVKGQRGQGLSDKDFKAGLKIASGSTPGALRRNMQRLLKEGREVYKDRFFSRSGKKYEGEFGEFVDIWDSGSTVDEKETQTSLNPSNVRRYNSETGMTE